MKQNIMSKRDAWIGQAACRGVDTNLFFPTEENGRPTKRGFDPIAHATCSGCPVLEQCAEWAVHHAGAGFQGGLTPLQRAKVRERLRIILVEPELISIIGRKPAPNIQHGTLEGFKSEVRHGLEHCEPCVEVYRQVVLERQKQKQAS